MEIISILNRLLSPIKRKVASIVSTDLLSSVNDSTSIQTCKLQNSNTATAERVQQFGFSSSPPVSSETVILSINGNRASQIIIACDSSQYRLKGLPAGSMAIYNQNGDYVKLTKDKIEIHANEVIIADGTKRVLTEDAISLLNSHVHLSSASGVVTGPALNGTLPFPFTTLLHATSKTKIG